MAVVEFEPGLIDAYEGEDKVADVLQAMQTEPFWLADVSLGKAVKGSPEQLAAALGPRAARWARRSEHVHHRRGVAPHPLPRLLPPRSVLEHQVAA